MASLLTDLINIEVLTGFHSSNALFLRTKRTNYLFTDGRYLEKARALARNGHFNVIDMNEDFKQTFQNLIKKHRIRLLEFESNHMTVGRLKRFKTLAKGVKWREGCLDVIEQRAQKNASEVRKLKTSQEINEQVFYSIKKDLRPGVTEQEIGRLIKARCLSLGADDVSFEPIVAFGSHSSMPHHQNTTRKLKKGDLFLIDMGVLYRGYASDMTRMGFTKTPTPLQEKVYLRVLNAQEAAIRAMKPGTAATTPDRIARRVLAEFEPQFTHSLGHGIGREVHEAPTLSNRGKGTLKPGMVVTSEPGVYLPGQFGVRIEDMILITPSGHQNLTRAPKQIKDCIVR